MRDGCAEQEYERTGMVWEQYDPNTGEGKRRCVLCRMFKRGGS